MKKFLIAITCTAPVAAFACWSVFAHASEPDQLDDNAATPTPQILNQTLSTNKQIDYNGFAELTQNTQAYRAARRVSTKQFKEMARATDTIILDTRSKKAFDEAHVRGAVHLNFSDFTDEKLAKVIPSKDSRILIYCNNNFVNQAPIAALACKRVRLALNIPTFINLVGYGYKNVYELGDIIDVKKYHLPLEGTAIKTEKLARDREFNGC